MRKGWSVCKRAEGQRKLKIYLGLFIHERIRDIAKKRDELIKDPFKHIKRGNGCNVSS